MPGVAVLRWCVRLLSAIRPQESIGREIPLCLDEFMQIVLAEL